MSKTVETTREMKNSGIEWLGKIPSDWNPLKLKLVFSERAGGAWGEDPKNNNNDVACIRIADFNYATFKISKKEDYTKRNYKVNQINKLSLKKGDLLIEKSGGGENTPVGRAVLFDLDIEALYANFMDRLRVRSGICPEFVLYLLSAMYSNAVTKKYIKQTTGIQNLGLTDLLSNEVVFIPPLQEQQAIANYLDEQVGKMDCLISAQKQAIEKWKAYKQSLITETVTKGLNPTAEMKDSGIEWIGEIPREWEVRKLKYIVNFVESGGTPTSSIPEFYSDNGVAWVSIADMSSTNFVLSTKKKVTELGVENKKLKTFPTGTLLYSIYATIGKVSELKIPATINQAILAIGANEEKILNTYLKYQLSAMESYVISDTSSSTQANLNAEKVKNFILSIPPLHEQQAIATYLDEKCSKIDETIEQKELLIKQLEEYKQSLIYECVTGKREVH